MVKQNIQIQNSDIYLPSKDELIDYISNTRNNISKKEIAKAFGLTGEARSLLKYLLKEMEEEGVIDRKLNLLQKDKLLPNVFTAKIIGKSSDNKLYASPNIWQGEGEPPRISIHIPRHSKRRMGIPSIGTRILLKLNHSKSRGKGRKTELEGIIIKILKDENQNPLGLFRRLPTGEAFFVPVNKKERGREIPINGGDDLGAEDGDLITVSVSRSGRFGIAQAKVKERLGSVKSEQSVSLIALHSHDIPREFSQEALDEAKKCKEATLKNREDWRHIPFITIDPPDAKDHDDAVYAEPDSSSNNPNGHILYIAIADVSYYVRSGSLMDKEALRRGNSVYFPDRVVPMLPEHISNYLCSLRPNEDKPALAVRHVIDESGFVIKSTFHRVLIRSCAKLSYEQAQKAIGGETDSITGSILETILKPLWSAYLCVKKQRDKRAPLELDLPERKILLDEKGQVQRVIVPEPLEAHRLIEEFMILSNVAAAKFLEKSAIPLIYRIHDEPSFEKMRSLGDVLASIGLKLPKLTSVSAHAFNRILSTVKTTRHETLMSEVVLRSQSQAEYSSNNIGHFGLNLKHYAHFTSPIRRYADLIVHRGIIRALKYEEGALPLSTTHSDLSEISTHISMTERRAMAAERETIERLIAYYLSEHIGATFDGTISGVTKVGLFIRLTETGADGFVPAGTLGNDYFIFDEKLKALVGERSNLSYQLGDKINVRLAEAIPAAGALRFEVVDHSGNSDVSSNGRKRHKAPLKTRQTMKPGRKIVKDKKASKKELDEIPL